MDRARSDMPAATCMRGGVEGSQRNGEGRYLMEVTGGDIYEGKWFNDKFHGKDTR